MSKPIPAPPVSTPVHTFRPDDTPPPDFDRIDADPFAYPVTGMDPRKNGRTMTEAGLNDAKKVRDMRVAAGA